MLGELNGEPWIASVDGTAWIGPSFPRGVRIWNSAQFATAEIIYRRVIKHRCRTSDARAADLFFIPSWSVYTKALPSSDCSRMYAPGRLAAAGGAMYNEHLRKVLVRGPHCRGASPCSALEARGGADHILVSPRNGVPFETHPLCELDYSDARLGAGWLVGARTACLVGRRRPCQTWSWRSRRASRARLSSLEGT